MSITQDKPLTGIQIPEGTKHYNTTAFAESWLAYDALTCRDGWREQIDGDHSWKTGTVNGVNLTIHAPHFPRPKANPVVPPRTVTHCAKCGERVEAVLRSMIGEPWTYYVLPVDERGWCSDCLWMEGAPEETA